MMMTVDDMTQLDRLQLALLRFRLRAEQPIELPAFSGSTFRGAFGAGFRRIACAPHCKDVATCLVATTCPYARIFEGVPAVEGYESATKTGVPKPFVIHPPSEGTKQIERGRTFAFHLALVGFAIEYLPYFILTWRELGRAGIGRGRGRFRLEAVESLPSFAESAEAQVVYSGHDELVHNRIHRLTATQVAQAVRLAPQMATRSLRLNLEFLMPTRIEVRDRLLRNDVPFPALIGALLRRLESLSYFYCGGSLELDYRRLVEEARNVKLVSKNLRWEAWQRYSLRQQRRIPWGGFVGTAEYEGDVTPFLPFLLLGEIVGVGKNCTFGLGRFRIHEVQNSQ